MKLLRISKKPDGFYLGDQKLEGIDWPFISCDGERNTIRGAWALCDEEGNIKRIYLSIGQCCTGLILAFYREKNSWITNITQIPIIAIEAEFIPANNDASSIKVTGQACNGKGTIQLLGGGNLWEWVVKEK